MQIRELHSYKTLMEANIVNLDDIENFIAKITTDLRDPRGKTWFADKVARFIRRVDAFHVPMTDQNRPHNLPDWAAKAVEQNPDMELHVFVPQDQLRAQLEHVVDYLNAIPAADPAWERLPTASVEKVVKMSERWVRDAIQQHRNNDAEEGATTVLDLGNMRWITTAHLPTVKRDGALLHNCLAQDTHEAGIRSGAKVVYILRDAANKPHVAMMTTKSTPPRLMEIKGKQNRPPVGRYVDASKAILNYLHVAVGTGNSDIQAMGLIYNPVKGEYGTASDFTEVVVPDIGYGFSVSMQLTKSGTDYYVAKKGSAHIARVTVDTGGTAFLHAFSLTDTKIVRELVSKFLNEHLHGGAPPPRAGRELGNYFEKADLDYDYHSKKYGNEAELTQAVYEKSGYRVVVWGTQRSTRYTFLNGAGRRFIVVHVDPDNKLQSVNLPNPDSAADAEPHEKYDHTDANFQTQIPLIIDFLNNGLEPTPEPLHDYYASKTDWRYKNGIIFNGKYGTFPEVATLVHKFRDGMTVRRWRDTSKVTYYSFVKGKDRPYEIVLNENHLMVNDYEWSHRVETNFGKLTDEQKVDFKAKLVELLNSVSELKNIDLTARTYELDDVVYHNGKWGTMAEVAEPVLEFKNGSKFGLYTRGRDRNDIALMTSSGQPVLSLSVAGYTGDNFNVLDISFIDKQRARTSGPALVALFDRFDVAAYEPPKGYQRDNTRANLFRLGAFRDNTGWKSLQKGKVVHKGDGYTAVNFRNRLLFFASDGSMIGEAKKANKIENSVYLEDLHAAEPWATQRDLLKVLADLAANSTFRIITPKQYDLRGAYVNFGTYGFVVDNGQIQDVEKIAPPEVVLELSGGWKWKRTPYSKKWVRYLENISADSLQHRYALLDPSGEEVMYAVFDSEGVLEKIFYEYPAETRSENPGIATGMGTSISANHMKDLLPRFAKLLQKQGLKLTATQARDAGLFVDTNGNVKMLSDDPLLKQYMDGEIKFKDGYVLKKQWSHLNEWSLWRPRLPDEESGRDYQRELVTIKLDEDGVESITAKTQEAKRNFPKYRRYLSVLLRAIAKISG